MKTETLTSRQKQVLQLIRRHVVSEGAPPTIRELREGLSLKSLRGVTVHLDALVRKGYIRRSRNARGIRLLRGAAIPRELARQGPAGLAAVTPVPLLIPVVGRIAAGAPLLAEQHVEERLAVDPRFVPGPGCFAIRVHGDSMINAGISDGDYIMVRPQAEADNGQIVAVLIEGEATVKRFYRERGGKIRLQPENPTMEPILLNARDQSVRVLGKVVGLFRKM